MKMSKRIKNPQLQAALLAIAISSLAWLGASLFFSLAPFGNKILCTNDGSSQYIPFLCEFWSIFHEGGNLLYSFHGGMGNNFYLTFSYYLLSPFTFLVLLFNKSQIPMVSNIIIILKNIFVIAIMAWYLASKGEKAKPILASSVAIAYGLSYYFLNYSFNFMWMDGIALVPLMLYGLKILNTSKGRLFYTLSLSLAILTNFYMGAIICVFIAFYYIVMQASFNKEGWKNFLIFSFCSICAALIAGVVLIPILRGLFIDNSSRMGNPTPEFYNDIHYFFSRILPNATLIKISSNRGVINLYMGVAPIFGILLFLFTKQESKREKYGLLFLIGIYLFSTQFSILNWLFHGLYMQRGMPNRYGFIINLLISIVSYLSFSKITKSSSKEIILAGFISIWYFGVISAWNSNDSIKLTLILSGVGLLYLIFGLYKKEFLISFFILIESLYGLSMLSITNLSSSFLQIEEYTNALEALSSVERIEYKRIEYIGKDINRNLSFLYGSNGVGTFNSITNSNVINFMGKIGYSSSASTYYFDRGWTAISALFLGVQDLISNEGNMTIPQPYFYKEKVDNLEIYQSPYDISFGVIPVSNQKINNENKFENLNILYPDSFSLLDVEASIEDPKGISTVQTYSKSQPYNRKYQINNVKKDGETIIKLNPFEGENIYIYTQMRGNKNFKILKNNKEISSFENSVVYVGSVKKSDDITVKYKASMDSSYRIISVQVADMSLAKTNEAGEYYSSHCLQNQKITGSTITGSYETLTEENMVFTLPYDKGWTAYVNGEKVSISSWQDAFLSIPLEPGSNEIKLTFFPIGLKEGIVISLSGLLLLWFLVKRF